MTAILDKSCTQQKAPTSNSGGLVNILADFAPATRQALADDSVLTNLYDLQHELDKPLQLDKTLLYLDRDISITSGELAGEIAQNTANTIGLVLVNNQDQPVSIASYAPNSHNKPFITDTAPPCAFVIGDMSQDSDWWAVDNLADAIKLYTHLTVSQGLNISVLVSINAYQFNDMVRHFSEVQTVTIATTIVDKDKVCQPLAGVNAKAIVTVFDLLLSFDNGQSLDEILSDPDTITHDLMLDIWGEPEPLANDPSKPTPYPIDAWQGLLKQTIERIAYHTQTPLAMAGQCVLGAIAHIGQRFINAPFGHKSMPASLILITEGESGSGKSQAMGLSHFKIKEHERQQYESYLLLLDEWESQKTTLKGSELKDFLANEPKPQNPITLFDDATIEPILDKFINGDMNNGSWSTDEAGQFFNGHTMKGDTAGNALSALTKLWSDGQVSRVRSQKNAFANARTHAYDVRMTLMLMGQRVILEQALTDEMMNQQGFLARALIACPESLQGKRVWNDDHRRQIDPYSDPVLIAYWQRCHILLDPLPSNVPETPQGQPNRLTVRWADRQAEQAFYERMQAIENRQAKGQVLEYLKAYASRMAENASRIASLMAFFDDRKVITADDINRAFELVEYSTSERLRYLDATPTGEQNDSEKLSCWLVDKAKSKNPPMLNRSYIYNGSPKPMRKNNKLLQNELDMLESAGHIKQETEGKKKVIYINPKLLM
ncbi:DUF3987 domain-containing protein [Psychrobacter sp. I-STPA6b]|uniref:DUF3987 domain-containing protein n=1 Tax=Psychrobacter sp. I-STPA6b TaxID=2585718 RepID=UPI001D0C7103|nr:DUF3987 domain-containing protein [Psychrobacter sp. I-STPA6b]